MTSAFVYTAVFSFLLASGDTMVADDASYRTYDACMMQAEADAKGMAKEWAWEEARTGLKGFYKGVTVRCEKRPAPKTKKVARHGK